MMPHLHNPLMARLGIPNLRLAALMEKDLAQVLTDWERMVMPYLPPAMNRDSSTLCDGAAEILHGIMLGMNAADNSYEGEPCPPDRPPPDRPLRSGAARQVARTHALRRIELGFNVVQLTHEYSALRVSVLKHWAASADIPCILATDEVTRFNEALDRSLIECVTAFTQEVERKRNLFLAVVGHDLRNPLMAILSSAHGLARRTPDGPEAAIATRLTRSAASMERLLDDLVDFNRATLGKHLPITIRQADLGEICAREIDGTRSVHADREIRYDGRGDLRGVWDAGRIQQLLSNLLKNALDYGDRDEPVEVRATGRGDEAVLSVHNRGAAIPPATLLHIFEPLTRGKPAQDVAPSANLGLGLFIAQEIARAHGGSIRARSDEHETVFTVHLPR
jgi:signal transduction histidine kinase